MGFWMLILGLVRDTPKLITTHKCLPSSWGDHSRMVPNAKRNTQPFSSSPVTLKKMQQNILRIFWLIWHKCQTAYATSRNPFFKGKPTADGRCVVCPEGEGGYPGQLPWWPLLGGTGGVPWSTSMMTTSGGGGTLVHFHDDHFWGGVPWSTSMMTTSVMTTSGGVPWSTSMMTTSGGVCWSTSMMTTSVMTTSGGYPGQLPGWPLLGGWGTLVHFHDDHFWGGGGYPSPLPWWPLPWWPLPWWPLLGGSHVTSYPTMQFMLSLLSRHQNDGSGLVHMLI